MNTVIAYAILPTNCLFKLTYPHTYIFYKPTCLSGHKLTFSVGFFGFREEFYLYLKSKQ